jgi:hypothetical protein
MPGAVMQIPLSKQLVQWVRFGIEIDTLKLAIKNWIWQGSNVFSCHIKDTLVQASVIHNNFIIFAY